MHGLVSHFPTLRLILDVCWLFWSILSRTFIHTKSTQLPLIKNGAGWLPVGLCSSGFPPANWKKCILGQLQVVPKIDGLATFPGCPLPLARWPLDTEHQLTLTQKEIMSITKKWMDADIHQTLSLSLTLYFWLPICSKCSWFPLYKFFALVLSCYGDAFV